MRRHRRRPGWNSTDVPRPLSSRPLCVTVSWTAGNRASERKRTVDHLASMRHGHEFSPFSILASRVPCSSVLRVSQFAGLTACHTSLGRDEETFLPRPGPGRRLVGYQRAWTTTSFLWVLPTTRCCQNLSFDLMPPLLPLLTPVSHTALVHIQRPAMWRQCVVLAGRSSLRTTRASILERWFPVPWWRRGCDKKPSDRRIGQR